jgi:2-dehydropantoate 2-reductase
MKILIMGSGAIGSVFGGFLAQAGHEITLVGRKPHMEAIARHQLKIIGIWGSHRVPIALALTHPPAPSTHPYDVVFIAVKSYDTYEATQSILHLIGPKTLLVSLQNGLNNYETIASLIEEKKIVLARVIFGTEIVHPGVTNVTVYAEEVQIGHPKNNVSFEEISEIARLLTQAGIPTHPTREILKYIWSKVLYNCALNPLSALLDCTYGELLTPFLQKTMKSIISEIYQVAHKKNIQLFQENAKDYIDELFRNLIPSTAMHRSSMLQDLKKGKKTEIDALNGAIVKIAQENSISVPMNETLTTLIKAKEALKSKTILQ